MDIQKQPGSNGRGNVKRMMTISVVVIFTACCVILFYFGVERYQGLGEGWSKFMSVLQSIIIGFGLAFLMNPIMEFFERHMYPFFAKHCKTEENAKKTTRMLTSLIALVIVVGIIVLFFVAIIPQLYQTIHYLVTHINEQIDGVLDWANQITGGRYEKNIMSAKGSNLDKAIDKGVKWLENYIDVSTKDVISVAVTGALGVGRLLVNCIIGIIVSVYVLCSKETFKGQAKKLIYGIFRADQANVIMEIGRKTRDIFYGFIIGKIIDSAIIGVLTFVCCNIFGIEFAPLIAVVVGITNIIPVFGPFIGAIPCLLILVFVTPFDALKFLILIIAIQQVDGNIIGPKILGKSIGVSALWVLVAIVIGGDLLGVVGMVVGVPTFATCYGLLRQFTAWCLERRGIDAEGNPRAKQAEPMQPLNENQVQPRNETENQPAAVQH